MAMSVAGIALSNGVTSAEAGYWGKKKINVIDSQKAGASHLCACSLGQEDKILHLPRNHHCQAVYIGASPLCRALSGRAGA